MQIFQQKNWDLVDPSPPPGWDKILRFSTTKKNILKAPLSTHLDALRGEAWRLIVLGKLIILNMMIIMNNDVDWGRALDMTGHSADVGAEKEAAAFLLQPSFRHKKDNCSWCCWGWSQFGIGVKISIAKTRPIRQARSSHNQIVIWICFCF